MQQLLENHIFTGMQKDLSVSKHPVQFLYDARNIRLTARERNTLLSITNERSTKLCEDSSGNAINISGTYLGHCLLNKFLVVFSKNNSETPDHITRIDLSTEPVEKRVLYSGNLGFDLSHPIEAIGSYESEAVQKVYWTDDNMQPRVINIVGDTSSFNDSYFDFIRELQLKEEVHIQKQLGASGTFAPGVIQYAFTYYTKYGQESNIFYTSPLLYISHRDRGASPEETSVDNAFKITVSNLDYNFDYLRIYSIQRTSIDGTPIVKRVQDINLLNASNAEGESIEVETSSSLPEVANGATAINLSQLTPIEYYYEGHTNYWYSLSIEDYPNLVIKTPNNKFISWGENASINRYSRILVSTQLISGDTPGYKIIGICINEETTPHQTERENIYRYNDLIFGDSVSFLDTGTTGNSVDPTELLYKGGETIQAKTLEQKDNTLFFGNIKLSRPQIDTAIRTKIKNNTLVTTSSRSFKPLVISTENYAYSSQLTAVDRSGNTVPCAGFKVGDYYRLGVQFQDKTGKWGDPVFIGDHCIRENTTDLIPKDNGEEVEVPTFQGILKEDAIADLGDYTKVRPVVVYPSLLDRVTICQGVACPTVYTQNSRNDNSLYAQSSWFFRPNLLSGSNLNDNGTVSPVNGSIPYMFRTSTSLNTIREVEIQGNLGDTSDTMDGQYKCDSQLITLHSPDVEFDEQLSILDYSAVSCKYKGYSIFEKTLSDINIQTETPTVSSLGAGFVHKSFVEKYSHGIVAGLFWEDGIVTDYDGGDTITGWKTQGSPVKWMVYPWQKSGSLNNDINRPSTAGVASALLKKKVISNLRYATTKYRDTSGYNNIIKVDITTPQVFNSSQLDITKLDGSIYQGNIDTVITPANSDGLYFAYSGNDGSSLKSLNVKTPFTEAVRWKTSAEGIGSDDKNPTLDKAGLYHYNESNSTYTYVSAGKPDFYVDLAVKKEGVRMKYKSTPHIVIKANAEVTATASDGMKSVLPVLELIREGDDLNSSKPFYRSTMFGGTSEDALKANIWIPCGEPVRLDNLEEFTSVIGGQTNTFRGIKFHYSWGDTYYQRWDCLKTYPFTLEDVNQIVEIGSFMLETHVNIDGRYDRNRGQLDNTMMTPQNFNLLNPVYSQLNNFFTYRILDKDYYENKDFPNQITWTKEKGAGADVDLWTNLTLASSYNMDGSKGEINSLNLWKDNIYCFQDKGVSNILFNSRVQIPTSDGVPIEITNNYKVDGCRYISDGIGCMGGRLIKETPAGIYFIDSISNHPFKIGDDSSDLASVLNMTSWFKNRGDIQKLVYDEINHDLYTVCSNEALCYSEPLQQFTSFMDYGGISFMESYDKKVFSLYSGGLYQLFAGDGYCNFFGTNKPWSIAFISNGSDNNLASMDKTFTNLEFRATVDGEGIFQESEFKSPFLPIDHIEAWNEFQHGLATLSNRNGHEAIEHHASDGIASLKRKFRVWRCDIPRDNAELPDSLGLARYRIKRLDRMRNLWLYLKLQKNAAGSGEVLSGTELHDIMVKYFV